MKNINKKSNIFYFNLNIILLNKINEFDLWFVYLTIDLNYETIYKIKFNLFFNIFSHIIFYTNILYKSEVNIFYSSCIRLL